MTEEERTNLLDGMRASGLQDGFVTAFDEALDSFLQASPNPYMLAIDLVSIAADIVLKLEDNDDFLAFGKYLHKLSDSVTRCAQTKLVVNHNDLAVVTRGDN